jgi:hypothetical protein
MGFRYIQYEDLGVDGSSDQYVYVVLKKAVKMAVYSDIAVRTGVDDQIQGSPTFLKANMTIGAVRMWEEGLVRILCDPTPTYALA